MEEAHVVKGYLPTIQIELYDPVKLRKPVSIADLGREGSALFHTFGSDLTRRVGII